MASIENRSHYEVTVKNRPDLTKTFPHNSKKAADEYCLNLSSQKLKPRLTRLDNAFIVRERSRKHKNQTLPATSLVEARDIKNRLASEHRRSIFTDYTTGYKTTFADLLVRYLHEEAPRQKGFDIVAYKINAMLDDAGFERQDLSAIIAAHPNPCPKVAGMTVRKSVGQRVGTACDANSFIRKPFAAVVPDDFKDYIDERCQVVAPATADREIDIFSSVCSIAINMWRIHVEKSPMDGVRRPKYYNERDRRLKVGEEKRLIEAAREEDRQAAVQRRLEDLIRDERTDANNARTTYGRKQIIKQARQVHMEAAETSYIHVPYLETFIQFQLMTGARLSETLTLTWNNVNLDEQTAFLPETKNGRSRELALRSDLVTLLIKLPRDGDLAFPISVDRLRKAWERMCDVAGFTGENELRKHDLRHEAISRVAEAGSNTPGGFSLVDLQHFSGHRDVRMLLRYAHLCTKSLAKRLDAAFAKPDESDSHRGQRRLKRGASISMREVIDESCKPQESTVSIRDEFPAVCTQNFEKQSESANVIRVQFGKKVA
ncbi:site-specific integrase [Massilia sp. TWR1-2-2]|uniref:site-specific integrase n=1 Tax=Massilia sp. TWR1-2-2 TaxID=2804584 RepID=UPI003CF50DD1